MIRALCVMKNEADVIEQTLLDALRWCDVVYVLDNGSDDGGWERVQALALTHPAIVPHGRDERPFTDDIRAQLFDAYAPSAEAGDWWCRLDADEFYLDDPRQVLADVPADSFSVWSASLSYYFTDEDAARFAADPREYADSVPVEEKIRYYLNHWSEPRFFRHEAGLRWREGDGGYPATLWTRAAAPRRIRLRHFPYRSPEQIQRRLDARGESLEFAHENVGGWAEAVAGIRGSGSFVGGQVATGASWRDRVVPASALDYDAHDGVFVINERLMPPLPKPLPRSRRWAAGARSVARRLRGVS
jgi:glycosyltransferase involved in cell wall biosynthesis